MFNLTHTHKISALRWRELQDDHFFLISFFTFIWLSPFFGYKKKKKQVDKTICLALTLTADLLDFHCWSSLPVILIWRQRLWRLLGPCVRTVLLRHSEWGCCAMSLLLHFAFDKSIDHVLFVNSLSQGASVLLSFSFFFPFFSTANLNNRAVSLAKNV